MRTTHATQPHASIPQRRQTDSLSPVLQRLVSIVSSSRPSRISVSIQRTDDIQDLELGGETRRTVADILEISAALCECRKLDKLACQQLSTMRSGSK
jgi:hypothetical protein